MRIKYYADTIQTNQGSADVSDWDFSQACRGLVRVTMDSLFKVEFDLPDNWKTITFARVSIRVLECEVEDPTTNIEFLLDTLDWDFIRRGVFTEWDKNVKEAMDEQKTIEFKIRLDDDSICSLRNLLLALEQNEQGLDQILDVEDCTDDMTVWESIEGFLETQGQLIDQIDRQLM